MVSRSGPLLLKELSNYEIKVSLTFFLKTSIKNLVMSQ